MKIVPNCLQFGWFISALSRTVIVAFILIAAQMVFANPTAVQIGTFKSPALWTPSNGLDRRPVVIMLPGSGPNGPRELIPGYLTVDGKDAPLFDQLSKPFVDNNINVLQLGKPGIEDLETFDLKKLFYDQALYSNLKWKNLIENVEAAIKFVSSQTTVDSSRIYLLGHSEGTDVAIDTALVHPEVHGLILLGFSGEDISTVVDWQFYKRSIEAWVAPDVDANHDGFVSKDEASKWPEFQSYWSFEKDSSISYAQIEQALRSDPNLKGAYEKMRKLPLYSDGIWNRGSIYQKAASLAQSIYVFTGKLDLQTPAREAVKLGQECAAQGKKNCVITLVDGVGHGFSPPRPPRSHPLLDITVGPAAESFLNQLREFARGL